LGGVKHEEFESILTGAAAGAPWAWSRLYHSLSPTVLGYLRARGSSEPEDLLGEVWLNVARRLGAFVGDYDGFRSWVFMIAHHRLIDERRKRGRRPPTQSADSTALAESQVADADIAMASIELEGLAARLQELPEQQQSVVFLRIVADLSVEQTAEVLDITPAAVKSAQYRAVKKLREILTASATDPLSRAVTEVK
jgi:RNA polymerase sigma-70 factor (ECF subfamily)